MMVDNISKYMSAYIDASVTRKNPYDNVALTNVVIYVLETHSVYATLITNIQC